MLQFDYLKGIRYTFLLRKFFLNLRNKFLAERTLLAEERVLGALRERYKQPVAFYPEGSCLGEISEKIQKNPLENLNPFGSRVPDLSLFVLGDTHFHPDKRHNPDPIQHLPTTRAFNAVRRTFGGYENWHEQLPPILHNQALRGWESSVKAIVLNTPTLRGENIMVVHAGDIAENAVAKPALEEAILETQSQMTLIGNHLGNIMGSKTLNIQALGDHDAERRSWENGGKHHQIEWIYSALGINTTPACYLQEIGQEGQKPDKAILMLDTNLMENYWIETVRQESEKLFRTVQTAISVQEALIKKAIDYDELVIIGHKPNPALETASILRDFSKNQIQTVIAGHRHIAYNSDKRGIPRPGDIKASLRDIRFLVVGAPTIGAGGLVIKGKAVGYLLKINSGQPIAPAYEVIPNAFTK